MTSNTLQISPKKATKKSADEYTLDELNELFVPLGYEERVLKLYEIFDLEDVLVTTSFGTGSIFLIHLLHRLIPKQSLHFINTTYHFIETIKYKNKLKRLYDLEIIEVFPDRNQNAMTTDEKWWVDHPKMCCTINKIAPLDPIIAQHKVWISGLMAFQTPHRANLRIFEKNGDILKFHPLVDLDEGEFLYQTAVHKLPQHGLLEQGYGSVGCTHCTVAGEGREGRWVNTNKTECGLHLNYFYKDKKH